MHYLMLNKKLISILNILALYLFFTGLFKTTKPKETKTTSYHDGEYKKLVFVLLDGLRIDGIVNTNRQTLYHNNFKFINNMDPKLKRIYLSVSGVPTATATRVRSILTGLPSNFLNGITTFNHNKIQSDSFIDKMKDKSHYFFGDNTWTDLFPSLVQNSVTLGAYDKVRPFETEINIINALLRGVGAYDYVLSHLVYLDHYGHEYTTDSVQVKIIMDEYNRMIEEIYEKMSEDTLICIYSDHGVNDDGSHGGASINELSSCCVFLGKKEMRNYKNEHLDLIRNKYLGNIYNTPMDWIGTKDEITLVHQNDIMPTVCALMGLPIPFYCCGNLIHDLVGDTVDYYKTMVEQKIASLSLENAYSFEFDLENLIKHNYILSELIINKFSGTSYLKVMAGLTLMIVSMALSLRSQNLKRLLTFKIFVSVLSIIMISHSVYSFLHEDFIWGLLYLLDDCSIFRFLLFLYFLSIGRFPQHDEDRFFYLKKISDYNDSNYIFIYIMVLFLLHDFYIRRHHKENWKKSSFLNYEVLMILLKYFYKNKIYEYAITILSADLTMRSIALIIYPPPTLFFIYLLKTKQKALGTVGRFAIQNMSLFFMGMNHDVSSINYQIPFYFSRNFDLFMSNLIMLFYLLYPRMFNTKQKIKEKVKVKYMLLSTFHVFMTMVIGYWFNNDFLFYFFFGGRCFFVCFYYLVENILMII